MTYEEFSEILTRHIFRDDKIRLLQVVATKSERFTGLFRPTKPMGKILQFLLQSHEIRMGDAFEELISILLKELNMSLLDNKLTLKDKKFEIDQYFTDGNNIYFVEQKIRDDHDSSKIYGQMDNFKHKLEILFGMHKNKLIGIMYFIDSDLNKNKNFYEQELKRLSEFYGIRLMLLYGKEFFDFFGKPEIWDMIIEYIKQWKESIPEIPEINFDNDPQKTFDEIKNLGLNYWRKILLNNYLWEEGIIKTIFRKGETLLLLLEYFKAETSEPYSKLAKILEDKLVRYYS